MVKHSDTRKICKDLTFSDTFLLQSIEVHLKLWIPFIRILRVPFPSGITDLIPIQD